MTDAPPLASRPGAGAPEEQHEGSGRPAEALPRWAPLLVWVPFVVLVAQRLTVSPDDAFITMRVAANLLDGHGPVFNPGDRVEGVTSPLHVLVSAALQLLPGGADLLKLKLASLAFSVLALRSGVALLDRCVAARGTRLAGRLLLGSSILIATNAASPLETALATWVTTAFVRRVLDPEPSSTLGIWAIAAVATRPEALGIVAAAAIHRAIDARRVRDLVRLRWLVPFAVGTGALLAVRFAYFGSLLPNTFVAKRVPLDRALPDGLRYLLEGVAPGVTATELRASTIAANVALAIVVGALAVGSVRAMRALPHLTVLPLAIGSQAAFVLLAGGDWMPHLRFIAPVSVLIAVVQTLGAAHVAEVLTGRTTGRVRTVAGWAPFALVLAATSLWLATGRSTPTIDQVRALDDRSLVALEGEVWATAPDLLTCAASGWTVADSEMGYGPWARRDLRFIDTRGLVDARIAELSQPDQRHTWGVLDPTYDPEPDPLGAEVLRRRPELIITNDPGAGPPPADRYRPVATWTDGRTTRTAHLRTDLDCVR